MPDIINWSKYLKKIRKIGETNMRKSLFCFKDLDVDDVLFGSAGVESFEGLAHPAFD